MTIKISKLLQQSSPTSQYLELTRATLSFHFPLLQFPLLAALCTIAAFYLETICLIVLISEPDSNCNLMRKIIFVMKVKNSLQKVALCMVLLFSNYSLVTFSNCSFRQDHQQQPRAKTKFQKLKSSTSFVSSSFASQEMDSGVYHCLASNIAGTVRSRNATLEVSCE